MEICYTCLSKDRMLFPLSKFGGFLKEYKLIKRKEYMAGKICWECRYIIEKFMKFKNQVLNAQKLLKMQKYEDLKSLSSFLVKTKIVFDTEYFYTPNSPTISITTKPEEPKIKEEDSDLSDQIVIEKVDFDDDDQPETNEDIYVETLEKISVKRTKNTFGKDKSNNSNKIKDKFTTVVYSEEEMLKKREDKKNHHNFKKIPFKCDLCVLGFTRKETYEEHLEKKHDESIGPFKCDICYVRLTSQKALTRHRSQHYISHRCKFCPYVTSQVWAAVTHCRVKHGADTSGRIHCAQCDFVTSTPDELAEHTLTEHRFHCDLCGEKFKGKNTLRTHITRIHGSNRQFMCEVCLKPCATANRLATHRARHSATLRARLSHCAPCRKQFISVAVYRNHLRNSKRHANDLHQCPDCDKKFASKVYLTKHRNFYHLHKSKYKCDICNKLFISNWRLNNHKQKHHGVARSRDHACGTCGKKFYTQSTLRGHELTHSEQRTYMCEDCGDTFRQRPALYTHHRLVHRAKKK